MGSARRRLRGRRSDRKLLIAEGSVRSGNTVAAAAAHAAFTQAVAPEHDHAIVGCVEDGLPALGPRQRGGRQRRVGVSRRLGACDVRRPRGTRFAARCYRWRDRLP